MSRLLTVATGSLLGLNVWASSASAQFMYPGGYGGYGMSRWGANPQAGYMAGLGSYARGKGVYTLDKAKADAINTDTMIKWNKALRARQRALREDRQKEDARKEAAREARAERRQIADGTTLNNLLLDIFEFDPSLTRSARAKAPISPGAIREIPFEWDSEALTACIDQMTGTGSMPPILMNPKFVGERDALRAAVEPALREDTKGHVSAETRKRIHQAVSDFRTKFMNNSADYQPGYQEVLDYFTTMASLNRMLSDPSMQKFLALLEEGKEGTVGDLIAFMNGYNLRFGPARSDRQIEIYTRLVPALTAIRDEVNREQARPSTLDRSGEGMRSAAKEALKGMPWDQLEAHLRTE